MAWSSAIFNRSRILSIFSFERVGDKDIARSLYAFARGQNIYLLHAFVKKTDKTPAAAIKTAHTRLKEFK
ncbi:hypothetical protein CE143_02550 [Photorhabdus luminescens]|uniref:Type II toxin-antitoxin system RelE/ParE family toxin n=1 Tax=Photorhabdus akhurstii TaxID=171438 RepID=A0ABX8M398_9GAMM|nr:type II toxin-antitoxin system RelE/ParE family toxin [Photorhabdus hainanensis]MBS9431675.1 hypothetical protein [Photorhabdus hainanensis]PQQ31067.1 hypothetical protein C6H69_15845 [Photorhabdus luminescens]QXF36128.1 hypothetical protein B0X70_02565 [Photorhabdus akhurstii]UJD77967.1 hypothetical protein CE143_02550 [Photorhabdus luminescens]